MEDSFTKSESIGNGKLDNAIGLLTVDETTYAGTQFAIGSLNIKNYLFARYSCWLMSPSDLYNSIARILFFDFLNTGIENVDSSKSSVFPVISLTSNTKIINVTGTANNPYIVE